VLDATKFGVFARLYEDNVYHTAQFISSKWKEDNRPENYAEYNVVTLSTQWLAFIAISFKAVLRQYSNNSRAIRGIHCT